MSKYSISQIKEQNNKILERIQKVNILCEEYKNIDEITSLKDFLLIISSLSAQY